MMNRPSSCHLLLAGTVEDLKPEKRNPTRTFPPHLCSFQFQLKSQINLIAFLFSAAVGVIFGYTPARGAARLNPIDALRHE